MIITVITQQSCHCGYTSSGLLSQLSKIAQKGPYKIETTWSQPNWPEPLNFLFYIIYDYYSNNEPAELPLWVYKQ